MRFLKDSTNIIRHESGGDNKSSKSDPGPKLTQEKILAYFATVGVKRKFPSISSSFDFHVPQSFASQCLQDCSLSTGPHFRDSYANLRSRLLIDRLKETKDVFNTTKFVSSRVSSRKPKVSVIRFDRGGVLFAVGGSDGILRIYDFDECLARMQGAR